MGTSGVFGFYYQGRFYVIYNHWDSYPEGLGQSVVGELFDVLHAGNLEQWKALVSQLKVVSYDIKPTAEDIEKLKPHTNLSVSGGSTDDWYCLLRDCQGSLEEVLKSGYCLNHCNNNVLDDFGEYGYIVNLDHETLDFYHFCQHEDHDDSKAISFSFANGDLRGLEFLMKTDLWCSCLGPETNEVGLAVVSGTNEVNGTSAAQINSAAYMAQAVMWAHQRSLADVSN